MAGHSQFKNIMHRKGRQDAVRSRLFSKLAREINKSWITIATSSIYKCVMAKYFEIAASYSAIAGDMPDEGKAIFWNDFIELKNEMADALAMLDRGLPTNPDVRLVMRGNGKNANLNLRVRGIQLPGNFTLADLDKRDQLLNSFDQGFRALDQAGPLELQEDLHQEALRDAVRLDDGGQSDRLRLAVAGGQLQHRDTGVFRFRGEEGAAHSSVISYQ